MTIPALFRHRSVRACLIAAFVSGACSSGPSADQLAQSSKLTSDLVQCQSDRSELKNKLAEAQSELKRLKEAAEPKVNVLGGVALEAGPPQGGHMDANLTPEQMQGVKKVILSNGTSLVACYEKGLKRNPNLRTVDHVTAHFLLKKEGVATNVGFSPHVDADMEKCMAGQFQKWKFPTFSKGEAQFEMPVNLVAK